MPKMLVLLCVGALVLLKMHFLLKRLGSVSGSVSHGTAPLEEDVPIGWNIYEGSLPGHHWFIIKSPGCRLAGELH